MYITYVSVCVRMSSHTRYSVYTDFTIAPSTCDSAASTAEYQNLVSITPEYQNLVEVSCLLRLYSIVYICTYMYTHVIACLYMHVHVRILRQFNYMYAHLCTGLCVYGMYVHICAYVDLLYLCMNMYVHTYMDVCF